MTVHTHDRPDGVRVVVLDRPPANAIDESLLEGLVGAVDEAGADAAVRCLVVTGVGRFFCAGFDLRAPPRNENDTRRMVELYRESHRRLLALPKPTVAMINGHAIAGGLVLALACDHRFASGGDHRFGLNEAAIGAAYPKAAIEIVRLRLTHAAASELALGARLYGAPDLVRLGVVGRLIDAEAFEQSVVDEARRLGSFPREVYAHTKAALVADALARIDAEPVAAELETAALWTTSESRAARGAQRDRL